MIKRPTIFKGKKGSSVILPIFELLVVIGIIVLVNIKVQDYNQSQAVIQKKITQDLALMIDTLVAVPGDAWVEYPQDASDYSFLVSSNKVIVGKGDLTSANRYESSFTPPENYQIGGDVEKKSRICLRKSANIILLESCA